MLVLVFMAGSWIAGLVLGRSCGAGIWLVAPLIAALVVAAFGWRNPRARLTAACLVMLVLGAWRFSLTIPLYDDTQLAYYHADTPLTVMGYICDDPRVRGASVQLQVCAESLQDEAGEHSVAGRLVVNASAFEGYRYGQRLKVSGILKEPPIFDDFDYREYLAARGIRSVMRRAQVELLPGESGSAVTARLMAFNHRLRAIIERILPQPEAGLLQGVLLGVSDGMTAETQASFRRSGLTHILVVSGFNISILMQLILSLAQRAVRRQLALLAALGGIILFGMLAGFSAPVVRAWLMGALTILAILTGRRAHALTSLAVASLIMTAVNPLELWSVSFQLSFVATLSLILIQPLFQCLLQRLPGRAIALVGELLGATLAAQLLTLPIIWHYFGELSLVALLTNLLVLPLQTPILAGGAAATALGTIWLPAGRAAAMLIWPLLRISTLVPGFFSHFGWAAIQTTRLSTPKVFVLYGLIALGVKLASRYQAPPSERNSKPVSVRGWLGPALITVLVFSLYSVLVRLPDGKTHVRFLDVGQGDAVLITTPSGAQILIDGGADGLVLRERLSGALPLTERRLDLVVATHGDTDHIGGLADLAEYYQVATLAGPPVLGDTPAAEVLTRHMEEHAIDYQVLSRGYILNLADGLILEVLHPPADAGEGGNAESLVLRLVQGRFSLLLTGDANMEAEQVLTASGAPLSAMVLKVAHHGSEGSTSAAFLEQVDPLVAVISVGADNRFGHPAPALLERLAQQGCYIWRTDQQGTIEMVTDGERLQVRAAR
ncbi:MAG: DNA internalization-related competence protein ComEC/Rec2 [Chloroflexi bacterium]|nr:DNA internalization-related competence protein ComEC/Rec2 [Chloroflexota bacterium]